MVIVQGLGRNCGLRDVIFCLVDLAGAWDCSVVLRRSWLLRGCGGRRIDASGWWLGFGVVVAQVLVKSVSWVNGCGAFVKFE